MSKLIVGDVETNSINGSHSINSVSGTANGGAMSGDNYNQHFWTLKTEIEELKKK